MLRQNAVRSWNVMAITFTNKAAGELKERLRRMLGGEEGDEVFASTFHSACVRILRRWAEEIGYPRSFTIYDTDDAQRVMKTVYTVSYTHLDVYKRQRLTSTVVLPLPAPARMRSGPSVVNTACRCISFSRPNCFSI